MAVHPKIEAILADDRLDDESADESKCEKIEASVETIGWEAVLNSVIGVLSTDRRRRDHDVAAEVIWGAILDGRPMPADRIIALVYHRLDPGDGNENNLAWSIASKLKGVDYLSDYNPMHDPGVSRELAKLRDE